MESGAIKSKIALCDDCGREKVYNNANFPYGWEELGGELVCDDCASIRRKGSMAVWVDIDPLPATFGGRSASDYNGKWAGVIDDNSGGFIGFVREDEALLLQRCMRFLRGQHPITGEKMTEASKDDPGVMALAVYGE